MKQIFIALFAIGLYACSTQPPTSIGQLQIKNGIYQYRDKIYIGKAYSYFPYSKNPKRSIECVVKSSNNTQICTIEEFAIDGTLVIHGTTHNGAKEGIWYIYKDNHLTQSDTYKNNKKQGKSYHYRNGSLLEEKEYSEDILHGFYLSYYDQKEVASICESNGNIASLCQENDKDSSPPTSLSPLKERGRYVYNNKEGIWQSYYLDGGLHSETHYTNNVQHGMYTSYYNNGTLREQGEYNNGLKHGRWVTFYDNGQIKS